jgi:hypothetical protein
MTEPECAGAGLGPDRGRMLAAAGQGTIRLGGFDFGRRRLCYQAKTGVVAVPTPRTSIVMMAASSPILEVRDRRWTGMADGLHILF